VQCSKSSWREQAISLGIRWLGGRGLHTTKSVAQLFLVVVLNVSSQTWYSKQGQAAKKSTRKGKLVVNPQLTNLMVLANYMHPISDMFIFLRTLVTNSVTTFQSCCCSMSSKYIHANRTSLNLLDATWLDGWCWTYKYIQIHIANQEWSVALCCCCARILPKKSSKVLQPRSASVIFSQPFPQ
jgi:hypothetical protein